MFKVLKVSIPILALFACSLGSAQTRSFAILDLGPQPGQFDFLDRVFDLAQPCYQRSLLRPSEIEAAIKNSPKPFEVLTALGLKPDSDPAIFNQHFMVSQFRNNGTKTIFFLLPEAHGYAVPDQFREQNFLINFKQSLFAIPLTEFILKKKGSVLNLKEGIKGLSAPAHSFSRGLNRLEDAGKLYGANVFKTLANVFSSDQIYSSNLEDPLPFSIDGFLLLGKYKPGMPFDELLKNMDSESGGLPPELIPLFKQAFEEIISWDPARLAQTSTTICEYRSQQMALNAIALVREREPNVVFMTFGMAHSHGIVKALDAAGYSYVLLNANSRPL